MKKLLLGMVLFCMPVYAQGFDLVAELGNEESQETIEDQRTEDEIADSRGVFSFLNFSVVKKAKKLFQATADDETPDAVDSKVKETPLQREIRLAEEGNLDAQLVLGYVYLYGENGVQQDFDKAFHYYELAAAQNDSVALNNLGSLYFNGIGTAVDYRKATELFAQAAQNGSDDAAVNLAFIYLSGDSGRKHAKEAVKLFEKAANNGNNTAKFMWGYANYQGFGMPKNYYKAIEMIRQAAEAEFDEAQYILGLMYMKGLGVAQNYGNAVRYLRLAAAQGNMDAMMLLADILAEGSIYPKNILQAHVMYNIAAVYGVAGAAEKRDDLAGKIKIEMLLQAQAEAEKFSPKESELTAYVRRTFGQNARQYIDNNKGN